MFWTLQIISKFVEKVTVKKILETQPYKTWAKCKQKNWTPDRVLPLSLFTTGFHKQPKKPLTRNFSWKVLAEMYLDTISIKITGEKFTYEILKNRTKIEYGHSGRKNLPISFFHFYLCNLHPFPKNARGENSILIISSL